MIYSTPEFFIFFIVVYLWFCIVKRKSAKLFCLTASSLFFYAWTGAEDTIIFLSVVVFSWLCTDLARRNPPRKKLFITIGIVVMTAHLFFWKYSPWVVSLIQTLIPHFYNGQPLKIPLPVGISFFTLQGIAYLIDYSNDEARFILFKKYLLFKSFFPQLVAGPIVRSHQLLPQLDNLKKPQREDVIEGLSLFSLGFFKKIALADSVAPFVDLIFNDPASYHRYVVILSVFAYSVQIWADFSGYTDMGRGVAQMMGIHLPENFKSPYLAQSPSEFWKRWHITLSEWIRDYIYIPLGGSRGSGLRIFTVAVITMAISGLWHGAAFVFLAWGLYHGILLVIERQIRVSEMPSFFSKFIPPGLRNLLMIFIMYGAVCFGWILFRAQTFSNFLKILRCFSVDGSQVIANTQIISVLTAIFACFAIQIFFWKSENSREENRFPSYYGVALRGLGVAALIMGAIFLRHASQSQSFIYFQF